MIAPAPAHREKALEAALRKARVYVANAADHHAAWSRFLSQCPDNPHVGLLSEIDAALALPSEATSGVAPAAWEIKDARIPGWLTYARWGEEANRWRKLGMQVAPLYATLPPPPPPEDPAPDAVREAREAFCDSARAWIESANSPRDIWDRAGNDEHYMKVSAMHAAYDALIDAEAAQEGGDA